MLSRADEISTLSSCLISHAVHWPLWPMWNVVENLLGQLLACGYVASKIARLIRARVKSFVSTLWKIFAAHRFRGFAISRVLLPNVTTVRARAGGRSSVGMTGSLRHIYRIVRNPDEQVYRIIVRYLTINDVFETLGSKARYSFPIAYEIAKVLHVCCNILLVRA